MPAGERGRPPRAEIYERLRVQTQELDQRHGGLPSPSEAQDIWRDIWHEETHHSTAIEGNTLVLREVTVLLEEGRAVGAKELKEYLEVRGYADAAEWVYSTGQASFDRVHDRLVTLQEVRETHQRTMGPVWDVAPHPDAGGREGPGMFREHEIAAFPGGMKPVTRPLVAAEMDSWLGQVSRLDASSRSFAEDLAALHARFEQVHPFIDGNGRTGRLVLNLILVRLGLPPIIVRKHDRGLYLRALRRADDGDHGALAELLARAILDCLYRFVVPALAGPARLVPLAALATEEVNAVALRAAAVRGALQASKGSDGQSRSSRSWVQSYVDGRWQRRMP